MGWKCRGWLRIGLLGCVELLDGAEANLKITVHLYDYSGVNDSTLTRAEREATRIYRHSGVEVAWMQCAESREQETRFKNCSPASEAPVVSVSILPPSMEGRMRASVGLTGVKAVSGIAVGGHAYVFLQRVIEICDHAKYPLELILGHVIAHELGHVLLGENSHSLQGIMSASLSRGDLRLALDGLLFFDSKQAARMRDRFSGQQLAQGR